MTGNNHISEEKQPYICVYSLAGKWQADIGDGQRYEMNLPGTLDGNGIGGTDKGSNQWHPESALGNKGGEWNGGEVIRTRFTRKHTFEGEAKLTRRVSFEVPRGKRIFLEAERARVLRLLLDGVEIPDFREPSISTPHVFELTDYWKGSHEITLLSDNSYPGLPRRDIVDSSAATDETQTNWNGVLGYLRLRVEEPVFVEAVRVYPSGNELTVKADICADRPWEGKLTVSSEIFPEIGALPRTVSAQLSGEAGITEYTLEKLPLAENAARWDEYEGNLHSLDVRLEGCITENSACDGKSHTSANCPKVSGEAEAVFGIRDFGSDSNGRLALNGRTIFLRSEANCAVFPETGYCPMTVEEWLNILEIYKSYGVNCMRFHSHCPPEAAFTAADRLGMLMQPELSHWNAGSAFQTDESISYYRTELVEILRMLANHPSFVMLTFGNELHASEKGHARMSELLEIAHETDSTRLYANGSNVHYGDWGCDADSDFYTSTRYYGWRLRGTDADMIGYLNHQYPNAGTDYSESMDKLRENYEKPVFSFEVGQFEVLPDFKELEDFHGISDPANLRWIQEKVREKGLESVWEKYVEAAGELSRICYREEVEAAMRTEKLSGISLLGLQDFPGQGTALVGMLNSHLKPKPYDFAKPERFRAFFAQRLPLVLLEKYTYESTEILEAEVKAANFGKGAMEGELHYRLQGLDFFREGKGERVTCPEGSYTAAGRIAIPLAAVRKPVQLELTVSLGTVSNNYPIWVYPPVKPVCPDSVYETERLDEKACRALEAGKKVYLTPPSTKDALPNSIQAQFSTDFWSVGTFSSQEGAMGQLIDTAHPVFRNFPTDFHTNWQWWPMATQRAVILPKQYEAIVTEMDSYAYLRPMAQLIECRCGNGKLLFSSMGLQDLQRYPEARALLDSIYRYMDSEEFMPEQEIGRDVWKELVK
ncbi:MAG TPA: hypothetical protein DCZ91_08840 [Lachnospiraceae bacterium]|nr:hypothetical protein [Lachnospiraceae bacterium]